MNLARQRAAQHPAYVRPSPPSSHPLLYLLALVYNQQLWGKANGLSGLSTHTDALLARKTPEAEVGSWCRGLALYGGGFCRFSLAHA